MKYSEKFVEKFLGVVMKPIVDESFLRTIVRWCIDSKFRIVKRVDQFLKEQIDNPDTEVLKIAKSLRKKTEDETIINVLKYVIDHIEYISDSANFGKSEYWATAKETLVLGRDDCNGFNSTIYVLARLAGVSDIKLWSVLGDTNSGYHYWLIYYSTKRDMMFAIDGTFYPSIIPISKRDPFILNKNSYTRIDYLFNENNMFIA